MDVDGTLTDGKIYMASDGEIVKAFNIKDGYGIHDILIPNGITPVIITGRKSQIVENRCKELGITDIFQGVKAKVAILFSFLKKRGSNPDEVAYIGDDLNDIDCMKAVISSQGIAGCPADAVQQIKEHSNYICKSRGGDGAVREFIDWLRYNKYF